MVLRIQYKTHRSSSSKYVISSSPRAVSGALTGICKRTLWIYDDDRNGDQCHYCTNMYTHYIIELQFWEFEYSRSLQFWRYRISQPLSLCSKVLNLLSPIHNVDSFAYVNIRVRTHKWRELISISLSVTWLKNGRDSMFWARRVSALIAW